MDGGYDATGAVIFETTCDANMSTDVHTQPAVVVVLCHYTRLKKNIYVISR